MKSIWMIKTIMQHLNGELSLDEIDQLYIEFLKRPFWFKVFTIIERVVYR